jgi:hypothetical protein
VRAAEWLESRRVQLSAVVAATVLIGAWHWANDGLWFQGDSPRHAVTGVFLWDALVAWPSDPLAYALSYFARYPAIVFGAYPPLFHLAEALVFGVTGPSSHIAKVLVLASVCVLGWYVMAWGRRWVSPLAGWAGACTVLLPWFVQFSNAVLLNVPATAAGVAALYHGYAWLETDAPSERRRFVVLSLVAVGTYLPGAIVVPIGLAWLVMARGHVALRALWAPALGLGVAVVGMAAAFPEYVARQGPSIGRLVDGINWQFYASVAPRGIGRVWLLLAAAGLVAGLVTPARRAVTSRLAMGILVAAICLALLPARDARYALVTAPFIVLTAFVAVSRIVAFAGRWREAAMLVALPVLIAVATATALAAPLKRVAGIDEVARYLAERGPADGVLYSGVYDGVFMFYVRALDPGYARRVVLSNRLLGETRQASDFTWHETLHATSAAQVVEMIRRTSGCRWVAIERGGEWVTAADRLLIEAAQGPDFERVASFAVEASPVHHIDLYRVVGDLQPPPPRDLTFPSFSDRVFRDVSPIPTR